jgi:hypothetical protein
MPFLVADLLEEKSVTQLSRYKFRMNQIQNKPDKKKYGII